MSSFFLFYLYVGPTLKAQNTKLVHARTILLLRLVRHVGKARLDTLVTLDTFDLDSLDKVERVESCRVEPSGIWAYYSAAYMAEICK